MFASQVRMVFAVLGACVCLSSTPQIWGQSASLGDYYDFGRIQEINVNAAGTGSEITIDLRFEQIDVEIDGTQYEFELSDMPDETSWIEVIVWGSSSSDEIVIEGRDEDDRTYRGGIEVYCFEGVDYVENKTDVTMRAFGMEGNDILIGGDGPDLLAGYYGFFSGWKFYDRNETDILIGGDGADYFLDRMYFYQHSTKYYLYYDGRTYSITKDQYDYYSSLLKSTSNQRGSTTYDFKVSKKTSLRYVSSETAQVPDLEADDLRVTLLIHDHVFTDYYLD